MLQDSLMIGVPLPMEAPAQGKEVEFRNCVLP